MKKLLTALAFLAAVAATAAELRIADATLSGDVPVKHLVLRKVFTDRDFRVSFDRVTAEEAFKRLKEGKADLVLADLPDIPEDFKGGKHIYGVEALVFYVNVANTLEEITSKQLQLLFTEEKPKWQYYNFMDGEVARLGLKSGKPGEARLSQMLKLDPAKVAKDIARYNTTPEVVLMASGDAYALGFALFLPTAPVKVKMLAVDGVAPTLKSVGDGSYPFAVKRAALTPEAPSKEAAEILALFDKFEFREAVENAGMLFIGK